MSTVNELFVSSEDSADCKPSKAELLRGIVADKLTTAAQEILAVVERTVSGYEEEAAGLRQEIERQRKHLEQLLQPQVSLCRIDEQLPVCDPAAGGAGLPEESEQHKYEPSWSNGDGMETCWAAGGGGVDDPLTGGPLTGGGVENLLTGGDDTADRWTGEDHVEDSCSSSSGKQVPADDSGLFRTDATSSRHQKRSAASHSGAFADVKDLERPGILCHAEEQERLRKTAEEPGWSTSLDQQDLRVTDHQIPNIRSQPVMRNRRSLGPTVHLRVCLLKDSHTEVLKKGVLKSPMTDLKCPRGLQEPDFLDLLRSTFPQLAGPFDVFTTDGTKKLTPLTVRTLTPEEIKQSIKLRSALYISTKRAKKTEQLPPPQRNNMRHDENGPHASSVEKAENDAAERLSSYSRWQQQIEREDDGERGFSALSYVRPAAQSEGDTGGYDDDDDGEVTEDDRDDDWKPNRNSDPDQDSSKTERSGVKTLRRNDGDAPPFCKVCRTLHGTRNTLIKHSWSHVDDPERLCGVCGEHSESAEELRSHLESHQRIHNDTEDSRSLGVLGHAEEEEGEDEGEESAEDPDYQTQNIRDQSVKRIYARRGLLSLKVCVLKDKHTDVLKKGVLKCPMRILKCPRALQEPDFLDLLRSTFPQLTGQFDLFTTDGSKKLTPLNVWAVTPEEIKRSIKSALYISTKRADKSQTSTEQQPPFTPPQKKDRPHASSVEKVESDKADSLSSDSRRRQRAETAEDGEQRGISDSFSGRSSVHSAADSGDDDETEDNDEDDEWEPDKNDEAPSEAESDSSKTTRKQRVKRSGAVHKGEKPYKCDTCHRAFRFETNLRKHRWEHVEDKPHRCDVCNKSFGLKEQLMIHSRTHTDDKSFTKFLPLSRHKLCHGGEKCYSCLICGKCFLTPRNLKRHAYIHRDRKKRYLCDICCKAFFERGQLVTHLKIHRKEKIICKVCGKGLSCQSSMERHMLIHTGEKPYKCSECGRSFNTQSILKNHLLTHSGLKLYVCGVCGKSSAQKASLTSHMRTHTGEKPYKCTVCNRNFAQRSCLKTHMKRHEGEEKAAVDGPKV